MKTIAMILGILLLNSLDSFWLDFNNHDTAKHNIDRPNYQLLSEAVPPDRGSPRRRGRGRLKDSPYINDDIRFLVYRYGKNSVV
ncbi:hypothetical protein [Floridanema evergladense]|uniref:Uncharacterized protein n=1 Tax=Floridaenema evergladense BLCC-F167 TaxID=3153639 RepID=A0ABV4WUL1_9CYAN